MKIITKSIAILFIALAFSCGKEEAIDTFEGPEVAVLRSLSSFTPASAAVGTDVTIVGMGFGTDPNKVTVQFGDGAAVKPKSVVDDKIVVAVPTSSTTGQIKLTVSGASMTSRQTFTLL